MLCGKVISCPSTGSIWTVNNNTTSTVSTQLNQNLAAQTEALHAAGQLLLEGANSVLAHSLEQIKIASDKYPSAKADLAKFAALAPKAPAANLNDIAEVDSISQFANQVTTFEKLVNAKVASLSASDPVVTAKPIIAASPTPTPSASAQVKKTKTITCIKGAVVKKVTGTTPKCPTGYKLKV